MFIKKVQESAAHLLYKCRFTIIIWKEILSWCGAQNISPTLWGTKSSVHEWSTKIAIETKKERNAMASLIMLILWEI
jgi:hypothetical protein